MSPDPVKAIPSQTVPFNFQHYITDISFENFFEEGST
jgi:hypothetical protein